MNTRRPTNIVAKHRQRGAILAVSLMLLLVLTLLGITSMQMTRMEERMAGNLQDINVAFQGSETALRSGEESIRALTGRPTLCASAPCTTVVQRDGLPDMRNQTSGWWTVNANPHAGTSTLKTDSPPTFLVEDAGFIPDSLTVGHGPPDGRNFYRVLSHSTGATDTARAVLESTYTRRF